jgi:hypothetical protein
MLDASYIRAVKRIAPVMLVIACRLNQPSTTEEGWLTKLDLFSGGLGGKKDPLENYIQVQQRMPSGEMVTMASLLKSSCVSGTNTATLPDTTWLISIDSAFGRSELTMTTKNPPADGSVHLQIDDRVYVVRPPTGINERVAAETCSALDKGQSAIAPLTGEHIDYFKSVLSLLAPDCDFRPQADGKWHCHIDSVDGDLADREIRELQSTILRRWSRLPYILTRRLAVSHSLAQSVTQPSKFSYFCRILDHSIPDELPLVFSSLRWRQSVCGNVPDAQRKEAATIGLSKALGEIELLRQLFEQSSNLGMMTLRLPREMSAVSKEFWVSLSPKQDVAENLAKLSARIWAENVASGGNGQEVTTGCWHPIFGSEHAKLLLAKQLDLVGTAKANLCTDATAMPPEVSDDPHRYLAGSITSETEFVLNNFDSILLRLPIGSYEVSLRHYIPANDDWETDPPLLGTSEMAWTKTRPKIVINTLQQLSPN